MTGSEMKYGALSAKVHALFGKRLRTEEFARLARMRDAADLLEALRRHPGWSRALSRAAYEDWSYVGRVEVEKALWEELDLEYLSLAHYVPREDRELMQFLVRLAERSAILHTQRRLKAGKGAAGLPRAPGRLLRGRLDYQALLECTGYDQLLAAARESIYYPALLHLRPGPGEPLPDYTIAECLLRTAYFSHMYRLAQRQYTGPVQKVLLRSLGEQVDLLNIIHILRLKTYFPATPQEDYLSILYPFHYRLKPELIHQLCAAPDAKAVFALLEGTRYRDCFRGVEALDVEEYYRRALYLFNRHQLVTAPASVYTAMAYLDLKETEMMVLINVIESVKYGVPYNESLAELVGS